MALGFYFNASKCIGCRSCQVACKDRNNLDVGTLYRRVDTYEAGGYPDSRMFHFAFTCNHCENPACVANCPVGSMQKAPDGTVVHDDATCIGCGTCVASCPYGVPVLKADGIAGKCDSCKALRDAGNNPVCVDACIMRCLEFDDVDELHAAHEGEGLTYEFSFLPSPDATQPNTLVKPYYDLDPATDVHAVII